MYKAEPRTLYQDVFIACMSGPHRLCRVFAPAEAGCAQVPTPDTVAYCRYLGQLSALCVEGETLEARCEGALRCGHRPAHQ